MSTGKSDPSKKPAAQAEAPRPLQQAREAIQTALQEKVQGSLKTLYFPEIWYALENWFGLTKARNVLEVGYGIGLLSEALARSGWDVSLVEPSESALTSLRTLFDKQGLTAHFEQAEPSNLPFANQSFDHVVCVNTLELSAAPNDVVREIARVLKPGGRAFIATFNKLSPWGIPAVFRALRKLDEGRAPRFLMRDELVSAVKNNKLQLDGIKERARYLPAATRGTRLKLPITGVFVALVSKPPEPRT